jgi:hypothetical protein
MVHSANGLNYFGKKDPEVPEYPFPQGWSYPYLSLIKITSSPTLCNITELTCDNDPVWQISIITLQAEVFLALAMSTASGSELESKPEGGMIRNTMYNDLSALYIDLRNW